MKTQDLKVMAQTKKIGYSTKVKVVQVAPSKVTVVNVSDIQYSQEDRNYILQDVSKVVANSMVKIIHTMYSRIVND
jgi:hypothetical protein